MASLEKQKQAFQEALKDSPLDLATHLAYGDWLDEQGLDDEAKIQREWSAEKHKKAITYMASFVSDAGLRKVEDLLQLASDYLRTGEPAYLEDVPEAAYEPRVFWEHYEVLTSMPVAAGPRGKVFVRQEERYNSGDDYRCAC